MGIPTNKSSNKAITTSWYNRVRTGHIRKVDAWYYFQSTFKMSLEYPLVETAMTKN